MDQLGESTRHEVDSARRQWDDGERRVAELDESGSRADVAEAVVDAIVASIQERIGQTFSVQELSELYRSSDTWAYEIARSTAPDAPWAWELSLVQDAAYARYARRATDYQP